MAELFYHSAKYYCAILKMTPSYEFLFRTTNSITQ